MSTRAMFDLYFSGLRQEAMTNMRAMANDTRLKNHRGQKLTPTTTRCVDVNVLLGIVGRSGMEFQATHKDSLEIRMVLRPPKRQAQRVKAEWFNKPGWSPYVQSNMPSMGKPKDDIKNDEQGNQVMTITPQYHDFWPAVMKNLFGFVKFSTATGLLSGDKRYIALLPTDNDGWNKLLNQKIPWSTTDAARDDYAVFFHELFGRMLDSFRSRNPQICKHLMQCKSPMTSVWDVPSRWIEMVGGYIGANGARPSTIQFLGTKLSVFRKLFFCSI